MTKEEDTRNEITQLEEALHRTFRRQEAPPDFAEHVFAQVAEQNSLRHAAGDPWWKALSIPVIRWAAITATAASLVIGGIHYRNVPRERARGKAAKQQLMLALRIAGSKLQLAKARVNEINSPQNTNPRKNEEVKD